MKQLLRIVRELAGLFFDDGSLAIAILAILAATAISSRAAWLDGPFAMAFLVLAVIAALDENVIRTARTTPPTN